MRKSTGLTVRKFWFSPAECVHKDPPLLSTPVGFRGGITPLKLFVSGPLSQDRLRHRRWCLGQRFR